MKFLQSEFFKNNQGQKSMSRLLAFVAFPPATVALLWIHTEGALLSYLGAYGAAYILGKCADAYSNKGA
jgi:hypothetical protein